MQDFFSVPFSSCFFAFFSSFDSAFMQNSITFMGPFIVQNSQQRCYSAGRFGHFLEGKRPGKCQTWPQYNEDLWTCLGLFEPLPAYVLASGCCYVLATTALCTTMVENQKNSQWPKKAEETTKTTTTT